MLHLQPWHGLALLHAAAVAGGLLLYVGLTHSGRQRRPPSAAMAWVLALLAFPYLALPTYLLLGTRKLAHTATSGEGAQPPSRLADDPATRGLDLPPPRRCASVRIHGRGDEALQALLDLLAGAQRRIDVEIFIFRDDEVGRRIVEALASASRRGVMVRALIDGLGTLENHRRIRADLHAAGVRTRWFSPIRLRLRPQFGRGNLRNHRKLVLVDGRTLWSGGRNFAAEYFLGTSGTPAWHDLSFCIESGIVADAAEGFARDWALAGGTPDVTPPDPDILPTGPVAQLLPGGPDRREDTAYALYLNAIHRADARVWLATPYFVPDDALQLSLLLAARRGADVRLLLPARSNHRLADIARERSLRELAAAGVRIALLPLMLHAKLALVDRRFASCGSINLDSRSLFLNYELNVLFHDPAQIDTFDDWFRGLFALADAYTPRTSGWLRDLGEGAVRAIGFQL
ncbi:phospholipase D-like domain-containing protein [Thermomonas sp.]|uniref:phospholipase D-like domain-containing protein n=1 Tax=Thermomonas sp. TaxID=1971895 RepID=UPI00262BAADF|nr:phospholipase D-like domain-containing protein [Thermomonas sp.]